MQVNSDLDSVMASVRTAKISHHSQAVSLDLFLNVLIMMLLKSLYHCQQSSQDAHLQYLRLQLLLSLLHHSLFFLCFSLLMCWCTSYSFPPILCLKSLSSPLSFRLSALLSSTPLMHSLFSVALSFLHIFLFVVTQTPEPRRWDLTRCLCVDCFKCVVNFAC